MRAPRSSLPGWCASCCFASIVVLFLERSSRQNRSRLSSPLAAVICRHMSGIRQRLHQCQNDPGDQQQTQKRQHILRSSWLLPGGADDLDAAHQFCSAAATSQNRGAAPGRRVASGLPGARTGGVRRRTVPLGVRITTWWVAIGSSEFLARSLEPGGFPARSSWTFTLLRAAPEARPT